MRNQHVWWSRRQFLRRATRTVLLSSLAGGAADLLAACSGSSPKPSASAKPVRGGTIVEGSTSDIQSFNPLKNAQTNDQLSYGFLFEPLLSYDGAANLVPAIAQSVPN